MSTFIRTALVAIAVLGAASAASAHENPSADAKTFFELQGRYGN